MTTMKNTGRGPLIASEKLLLQTQASNRRAPDTPPAAREAATRRELEVDMTKKAVKVLVTGGVIK
jgi:hypothetical protein